MPQNKDRILTTHVGSLIRPPQLIEFWRAIEDGKPYDEAAFESCLTESVAEVVRQQAEAGIDIVSDGEFAKGVNWAFYIFKRLGGIKVRPATADEMADPMASMGGGRAHGLDFAVPGTELLQRAAAEQLTIGPSRPNGDFRLKQSGDIQRMHTLAR